MTTWEGGVRVPGIFWWPGRIQPAVIDGIGCNVDLAATVADLPEGEDLELRVFVDKYLVEVFANDRQSVVAADLEGWRRKQRGVALYAYGRPTTFRKLETWPVAPTTEGFHEATRNRIWAVEAE